MRGAGAPWCLPAHVNLMLGPLTSPPPPPTPCSRSSAPAGAGALVARGDGWRCALWRRSLRRRSARPRTLPPRRTPSSTCHRSDPVGSTCCRPFFQRFAPSQLKSGWSYVQRGITYALLGEVVRDAVAHAGCRRTLSSRRLTRRCFARPFFLPCLTRSRRRALQRSKCRKARMFLR